MYFTEDMMIMYDPTDSRQARGSDKGQHSDQYKQRFETIAQERLEAESAGESRGGVGLSTPVGTSLPRAVSGAPALGTQLPGESSSVPAAEMSQL